MKKIFILLLALSLTGCKSTKTLEEKGHENTKNPTTIVEEDNYKELEEKAYGVRDSIKYDVANALHFGVVPKERIFEEVEVLRVIDGDTIEVNIEGKKEVVRLIGVDSPESVHPDKDPELFGKESSEFTKENLLGMKVYLEGDLNDRDRYNRLLRYVWTEMPEHFNDIEAKEKLFNAKLVSEGYAKTLAIRPNVKYEDLFKDLEDKAKLNQKGMWSDLKVIKGNKKTKVYYTPDGDLYDKMAEDNIVYFKNEDEAIKNGYRKSKE